MQDTGNREPCDIPATGRVWLGCALPVLAWALHLLSSYGLTAWACGDDGGPAPDALWRLLIGLTCGALAFALAGMALSWSNHRRLLRAAAPRQAPRVFMARCGIALGGSFAVVVLVQGMPPLMLAPCI